MKGNTGTAEPSLAELARRLMRVGTLSTLSTLSQKHPGYPFGSVVPYATDGHGNPIFLISSLAIHSRNLRADPRATLLVAESAESLSGARVSVMGEIAKVGQDEVAELAGRYLSRHPEAKQWAGFGDFGFYRMLVKEAYFIGGFGVMGWVKQADYHRANPENA